MSWFHKHDWKLVGKTFAPPSAHEFTLTDTSFGAIFERALHGVTTFLWECEICGKTRKEECLGREVSS